MASKFLEEIPVVFRGRVGEMEGEPLTARPSCNPMKNGLNQFSYYIDFTNPSTDPSKDWSTSNYAAVTYNTKGGNNFYIFFGRVDLEMKVAPGVGNISSSVLMSDDFDEIDWEMSGNNFNLNAQYPTGVVQNNYFSKGITVSYDRGLWVPCTSPQTTFYTYSVDWTPTKVDWLLDGKVIRTLLASNADTNTYQFPQTPAKVQLGLWDGGDPDQNSGTLSWAGGKTNLWKSIKALNTSLSTSTTTTAAASTATTDR
ncbi:concanavalin A-like lectin/glucanase domain-containing protein [Biscogniauxia mediterranea]|nr:concanavalin A-like lectin/glucanase domain-containing protein [Biscogniauxia mediterranea]